MDRTFSIPQSIIKAPAWIINEMTDSYATPDNQSLPVDHVQSLARQCTRFNADWNLQQQHGIDYDTWFKWINVLHSAFSNETAHYFSQASTKHDSNSEQIIQKLNQLNEKRNVRCTKLGCNTEQIKHCFGQNIRRDQSSDISNSPASLFTQPKRKPRHLILTKSKDYSLADVGISEDKKTGKVSLNPNIFAQHVVLNELQLLYCNSQFYVYQHNIWTHNDGNAINRAVRKILHKYKPNIWTPNMESKYMAALRLESPRVSKMDTDRNKLNVQNGMVDLKTFNLIPHDPNYYSTVQLPIAYNQNATCPKFMHFLDSIFLGDQDLIALIGEMLGYCLTTEVRAQKAFILYGKGANGKSVLADILKNLCGKPNVTSISLNELDSSFARYELVDKILNLATENEVNSKGLDTQHFKSLVSGDPIRVEAKNEKGFMYEPFCKLVFALNNLPYTKDKSHGFARRLIIIPFNRNFNEKEMNVHLIDELLPELPGILNFALEGLQRLIKNKFIFTQAKASIELLNSYKEEINPVQTFVEDVIEKGTANDRVLYKDLGEIFRNWCDKQGYRTLSQYTSHRLASNIKDILTTKGYSIASIKSNGNRGLSGIIINDIHRPRASLLSNRITKVDDIDDMT